MRALKRERDRAQVEFSADELVILNKALNEVCNGIRKLDHDEEFHARLGAERAEARRLAEIGPIADSLR